MSITTTAYPLSAFLIIISSLICSVVISFHCVMIKFEVSFVFMHGVVEKVLNVVAEFIKICISSFGEDVSTFVFDQ